MTDYQVRYDFVGGAQPIYIGYSAPGTPEDQDEWRIIKYEYDGALQIGSYYPDGLSDFAYLWSLRATYDYAALVDNVVGWYDSYVEADEYFNTERLETSAWDDLTEERKRKCMITAYNRLLYNPSYSIPTSPSAAELVKLKFIQAEYAYYLALHLADEDRRIGLQTQHVTAAGIVKETYDKDKLGELPVPPFVDELLEDFKIAVSMKLIDIDRDEDESVDTEVDDF